MKEERILFFGVILKLEEVFYRVRKRKGNYHFFGDYFSIEEVEDYQKCLIRFLLLVLYDQFPIQYLYLCFHDQNI